MWTLVLIIGLTGSTAGLYPTEQGCKDGIASFERAYADAMKERGWLKPPALVSFCFKSETWR